MKTVALTAFAFAFALASTATATGARPRPAPFGIPMGTPIARLNALDRYGDKYIVVHPPVRNPAFERYTVIATPAHGVCAIEALMPARDTQDAALADLRSMVRLLSIYGRPQLGQLSRGLDVGQMTPGDIDRYLERYWQR